MNPAKNSGRIPVDEAATKEEIVEAFKVLSENELRRLYKHANLLANLYSIASGAVFSGKDLYQEAFLRPLDDRRRWRTKKIDFAAHLRGAIKSIAYELSNKNIEGKFQRVSKGKEGPDPIERMESPGSNIEERLIAKEKNKEINLAAKQKIENIKKHFEKDSLALEVIDGWGSGWGGPEIKEVLDLNQNQYETVVRRIRREVEKLKKEGEIHG